MCQYEKTKRKKKRTEDGQKAEKEKDKKREKKTSVLLFVFSLVYLVWGSLVYNIYHHVFQNWLYGGKKIKS